MGTLVSCVMPTAGRRAFVPLAIENFLRQDHPERELVIIDDGQDAVQDLIPDDPRIRYERLARPLTLGGKRNLGCEAARGDVIAHWDDDDWYAPGRVREQLGILESRTADLCGLSSLYFWHPSAGKAWRYTYRSDRRPWVAGSTMCYSRRLWERHRFPEVASGEDAAFLHQSRLARIVPMRRAELTVALIHVGNTSSRVTAGERWQPMPLDRISELMGRDFGSHRSAANRIAGEPDQQLRPAPGRRMHASPPTKPATSPPLVSCVMPTGGRPQLAVKAIEYFRRQDYSPKELVIVDDGPAGLEPMLPVHLAIRYLRLDRRTSIGAKRNLACRRARGELIAQWDDDDWYAPNRLSAQVAPIIEGRADITGLNGCLFFDLASRLLLSVSPAAHRRMFAGDVVGGTLVFRRSLLEKVAYPERSLAEDALLLKSAIRLGARLARIPNEDLFVYVRHGANTWGFEPGSFLGSHHWRPVDRPVMSPAERDLYIRFAQREGAA